MPESAQISNPNSIYGGERIDFPGQLYGEAPAETPAAGPTSVAPHAELQPQTAESNVVTLGRNAEEYTYARNIASNVKSVRHLTNQLPEALRPAA